MTERDEELENWLKGVRPPSGGNVWGLIQDDLHGSQTHEPYIRGDRRMESDEVVYVSDYSSDHDGDGNVIRTWSDITFHVEATIMTKRGLQNLIETLQGKLERWA